MLDHFGIITNSSTDIQTFRANYDSASALPSCWHTWLKPKGASMVWIFCLGSGGGGGAGVAGANNAMYGSTGGGSSGHATVMVPAFRIPDVLYVSVPSGGSGGTGGSTGGSGGISYVTIAPAGAEAGVNDIFTLARSCNAAAIGGNPSLITRPASADGSTISTIALMPLAALGNYYFIAGVASAVGANIGSPTGGAGTIATTGACTTPGAGGAPSGNVGSTNAGGQQTGGGIFPTFPGGIASSGAKVSGGPGCGGIDFYNKIKLFRGGTGGGGGYGTGADGSNGGAGGPGGFGSGGGGGGACLTGMTPGDGGWGGPGLVIIISW